MCDLNTQTRDLLAGIRPATPPFVTDLLAAYVAAFPAATLQLDLYAEPYYGDYNNSSLVLLTHNPGKSTVSKKGIGSPFEAAIYTPHLTREDNYFNIATIGGFPNADTNNWLNNRNNDLQNHFNGLINFKYRLFIRDLVPYHGQNFGELNMTLCTNYLYKYFFCQVINASFSCELYRKINAKIPKPASIIYARGKAWKERFGLGSIGWDFVGRIYWNCYVYKANFDKIMKIEGFNIDNYPKNTIDHDIYIVVITQSRQGAPFGIYINNRAPLIPIPLKSVIDNYDKVTLTTDPRYILPSKMMNDFFDTLRLTGN
jgi:hypothetical protein